MARPKLLNVREHLKHAALIAECYQKYGDCPAFREEFRKFALINTAILRAHEETREKGNRKDIRLPVEYKQTAAERFAEELKHTAAKAIEAGAFQSLRKEASCG